MVATVEIDKAGRIVVPKKMRDDLHLVPGTRLRIERSGDRLTLMPASTAARLVIEDGTPLVYAADRNHAPIMTGEAVTRLIEQGRQERERRAFVLDEAGTADGARDIPASRDALRGQGVA
jgi:AbrB family looped-hinge helix DNA binding protein